MQDGDNQLPLFGFEEMRPKASLKKIITRERMEEVKSLLYSNPEKSAQCLRELNEKLEEFERRINSRDRSKKQ
jgi:hypothetical protein